MFNRIAIYAVAHQDDWQLFMDPNVSADILDSSCKIIIIHTTAGDAGDGQKFWRAREKGAINSLLFRFSNHQNVSVNKKYTNINDKKIYLVNVANCSLYFLRLPDGGMHGNGFQLYDFQSLSKIRLKRIDAITTVDKVNTFHSFREISSLINRIFEREFRINRTVDLSRMILNFPEYDDTINPNDHNDHLNTALLLQDIELYNSIKKYAFVHYDIQHSSANLEGMNLFWKVGMFSVYHQTILNTHGYSTINESPQYYVWCTKNAIWREIG